MKKSVIISGAGSGIGRAIALELNKQSDSFEFTLVGRTESRLQETLSMLTGDGHQIVSMDLSQKKELTKLQLTEKNVYAVIANHGIGGENHFGENDRFEEVIQTNLHGTYYLLKHCQASLKKCSEKYRHMLIISSQLAHLGVPGYSAYCASKAALLGLMRSLASELAAQNILVNTICPGWVETDMAKAGIDQLSQHLGKDSKEVLKEQMSLVPLRKMSTPNEIAKLCHFLISPSQTSITGEEIQINNGAMMI